MRHCGQAMNTLLFPVGRGGTTGSALTPGTLLLDWSHTGRTQTVGCCHHMGLARDSHLGVDQTGGALALIGIWPSTEKIGLFIQHVAQ